MDVIGRNNRCYCNSGKKYKTCHRDVDNEFLFDSYTIGDLKLDYVRLTDYADKAFVYITPIVYDSDNHLGDMNAGLLYDINTTSMDYKILYKPNSDASGLLLKSLFHEMTHLTDYAKFVNQYNDGRYDGKQFKKAEMFSFLTWSEFHAQHRSYDLWYKKYNANLNEKAHELFDFEKKLILKMENDIGVTSYKAIIRFFARMYLFSLYDTNFKNLSLVNKEVIDIVESFSGQKFEVTQKLLCKYITFEDYQRMIIPFENWINNFTKIDAIKEEFQSMNIF